MTLLERIADARAAYVSSTPGTSLQHSQTATRQRQRAVVLRFVAALEAEARAAPLARPEPTGRAPDALPF